MVREWKLIREEKGGECPRQGQQEHSVGRRHLFVIRQGEFYSQ